MFKPTHTLSEVFKYSPHFTIFSKKWKVEKVLCFDTFRCLNESPHVAETTSPPCFPLPLFCNHPTREQCVGSHYLPFPPSRWSLAHAVFLRSTFADVLPTWTFFKKVSLSRRTHTHTNSSQSLSPLIQKENTSVAHTLVALREANLDVRTFVLLFLPRKKLSIPPRRKPSRQRTPIPLSLSPPSKKEKNNNTFLSPFVVSTLSNCTPDNVQLVVVGKPER